MTPRHPRISAGQYSAAGNKPRNDDSYGLVEPAMPLLASKGIAMAIADGMSSSEAAKQASETCIKSFLEDYYGTHESWTVKKSVGVVLNAANSWLYAQGQNEYQSDRGMVSTFTGAVLKAGMLHIFHTGDARLGRLRDGKLEPLTRDHRARVLRGQSSLSRAMGLSPNLEVDYRTEPVEAGDVLLFTTDGIHDHVPAAELARLIAGSPADLNAAARQIADLALSHGSADNLTAQIVRIEDPGKPDAASHLASLTRLPFPPELSPGMSFEGFRIVRELHASARSQVYLAQDVATGKSVAIKTPSANHQDDPDYLDMFIREAWIGRMVASPHVLQVMEPSRPRRHLYLVTEYFDGQTLRQWMHDHPRPDLETVRGIVEQIAKGLRAFHRKDILHQDLKPENLMIDRLGLVKIIDFGSSRAASLDDAGSPSVRPALAGTLDYTAPEYHLGEVPTNRADIYALGVIAYELLTGKPPYARGFASARDVARLNYVPATTLRDDIPLWMDAALEKAVHKQPANRTEALSALTEDIRRANPALGYDRPHPLMERNPLAFWRALALALLLANLALLLLLNR